MEALWVHDEGLVGGEDAEVGVIAQPDPALVLEPQQPGARSIASESSAWTSMSPSKPRSVSR